jgi:hypothetical protein
VRGRSKDFLLVAIVGNYYCWCGGVFHIFDLLWLLFARLRLRFAVRGRCDVTRVHIICVYEKNDFTIVKDRDCRIAECEQTDCRETASSLERLRIGGAI